jgi:hypothetical protein
MFGKQAFGLAGNGFMIIDVKIFKIREPLIEGV